LRRILNFRLLFWDGGGATQPLPRDGGVEELHGDPQERGGTSASNVSPPQRGGAVPAPLSVRWAEMARQISRGDACNNALKVITNLCICKQTSSVSFFFRSYKGKAIALPLPHFLATLLVASP